MRPELRNDGPGPEGPAPSVLPPTTALGLLLSRALSSGWASRRCTSAAHQTSPFWIARKRKTSGVRGRSPRVETPLTPSTGRVRPAACVLRCNPQSHVAAGPVHAFESAENRPRTTLRASLSRFSRQAPGSISWRSRVGPLTRPCCWARPSREAGHSGRTAASHTPARRASPDRTRDCS